ncbi:hypothetical protein HJC23_006565 [Cyclotella cryptica]|uniref:Uncharacterized protein n=1 Tax=Cyclotella cryptica TaxID=29204 RepID=A0ABD3PLB5_9STRA
MEVIASPPRFLATGYDVAALLNIVAAIALILNYPTGSVNSGRVTSITTSAAYHAATRYQPNLLATYTAGTLGHLFLTTGLCYILGDAVRAKRLSTSDTYKRLTLGTLLFGLIGLLSVPGEAGCNSSIGPQAMSAIVLVQISKFVTALVSFVGWEFGAGGFGSLSNRARNILKEIAKGCRNVWRTLPVTDDRPATFYRTFFLLVTFFNPLCNIPELSFNLRQGVGLFSLPPSLTISSIARLTLLSVILYVLKDAAERDRLERTTFVKLNIIVGLWAVGVGTAQGFSHGIFNVRRAADKFLFASLFFNNGIISLLRKMGCMKKTDDDPEGEHPLRISLF